MGIPGLTGFIDDNSDILREHRLHDTRLIIDGNNLYHFLYYNSRVPHVYGGDYEYYARCVREFFTTLLKCKISPYIVFDGAYDLNDRKLKTIIHRAKERIHLAGFISHGGRGKILPVLTYEVFLKVLQEIQIPHTTCLYEADEEIASLAAQWNCPVISSDSDFYIFNLPGGYLPMEYVDLTVHSDQDYFYLQCRIYTVNQFSNYFHLDAMFMPLFATLQGNDVINCEVLEPFYNKSNVTKTRSSKNSLSRRDAKIYGLMHWLSNLASPQEAIERVLECLPDNKRDHVRQLIDTSLQSYDTNKTGLSDNFTDKVTDSDLSDRPVTIGTCNLPTWFMKKFYHCGLAPFILNAILSRRVFILCQVEDMSVTSASDCAEEIRQIMYGILLNHCVRCDDNDVIDSDVTVEEYTRVVKTLTKSRICPSSVNKSGTPVPSLDKIPEMSYQQRTGFLLQSLGGDIVNLKDDMKLIISVVVYWVSHANPGVTREHVMALLVCMIRLTVIYPNTIVQAGMNEGVNDAWHHLAKFTSPPSHNAAHPFKCKIVHSFSQFQSCLLSAIHLNKLLDTEMPIPNISQIYDGTFLYNLCTELHRRSNPELYIRELLGRSSQLTELFTSLLSTVTSLVDDDCFVKTSPVGGKKRSKKTKCSSERKSDSGKGTSKHFLNNRFEALGVTD